VSWPLIGRSKRVTYLIGRDHRVRLAFHDEFKTGEHAAQACAAAPEAKG
jgi:peroxiredoxin